LTEKVKVTARVWRYPSPMIEEKEDGSRLWPLRGDLYLSSDAYPLYELEFGVAALVPAVGEVVHPPEALPPAGAGGFPFVVERLGVAERGLGGGLLGAGVPHPLFDLPPPKLPYYGFLKLTKVSRRPARQSSVERLADRLLSRLAYVRADYGATVTAGEIVNESEYAEQLSLVADARRLADQLAVPDEVRAAVDQVRDLVNLKKPDAEVDAAIDAVTEELVRLLWLSIAPPDPGAAADIFGKFVELCAPCHGVDGAAGTERARELDPPPASLADADFLARASPYRAFTSITWGVAGTAMADYSAALSARERWTMAFHVFSFYHRARAAGGAAALAAAEVAPPALEDLALMTDERLRAWLVARVEPAAVESTLAYLRTDGVAVAAQSPLHAIRSDVRAATAGYTDDRGRAREHVHAAQAGASAIAADLRARDPDTAAAVQRRMADLVRAIDTGAVDGDVRTGAFQLLATLRDAEQSLARPARAAPTGRSWWWLALVATATLALAALGKRMLDAKRSGRGANVQTR
jgi:hypothetical protein